MGVRPALLLCCATFTGTLKARTNPSPVIGMNDFIHAANSLEKAVAAPNRAVPIAVTRLKEPFRNSSLPRSENLAWDFLQETPRNEPPQESVQQLGGALCSKNLDYLRWFLGRH